MKKHIQKKQIWQVVDSRAYGGIESHICYLAGALIEKQQDVLVVFLNDYGSHPLENKLRDKNVPYIKCRGVWDFIQRVKKMRPCLIHSHGYKGNLLSRLAGKLYNVPTVSSFHAGDCETWRLKLYTTLDHSTAFLSKPVAINEFIAKTLSGQPQVIDNFVPVPQQSKNIERVQNIGFVGRLSYEKGPDRFIDLASRFPDMCFHIFGDGPMKAGLNDTAPENVKFHGHLQSMTSAWKAMDILCMPSRKEGLPMAALEAMAHGIPVLAYGAGALPKLIQHASNGWLVDLPDEPEVCSAAMEKVLRNLSIPEARAYGVKARQTIEAEYSQQALIPEFLKLYDTVLTEHTAGIKAESSLYVAS